MGRRPVDGYSVIQEETGIVQVQMKAGNLLIDRCIIADVRYGYDYFMLDTLGLVQLVL